MKTKLVLNKPAIKINIDTHQKTIVEIKRLIEEKTMYIQEIIRNTILSINHYKKYDIFSNSDVVICVNTLVELYDKSVKILNKIGHIPKINTNSADPPQAIILPPTTGNAPTGTNTQTAANKVFDEINIVIDELQQIIDKISIVICGFGTKHMSDLFYISFGADFKEQFNDNPLYKSKQELILKHIMPIGYKTIHWKQNKSPPKEKYNIVAHAPDSSSPAENAQLIADIDMLCSNKITDEIVQIELSNHYECYDTEPTTKTLYVKLYGVRVVIHNEKAQKTLIVQGIVDDIVLDCMDHPYIHFRKNNLLKHIPESETYDKTIMTRAIESLTLKDMLIYGNADIYKRHMAIMTEVNSIKYNKLNLSIKRFLEMDVYSQRQMLMNLLIYNKEDDIQYITYLLYDLITDSTGSATDSVDQMLIYESFPWKIKMFFKDTMKNTIKYTKEMMHKYDVNRVSLEQQIYVMKVPENVREKAMAKLKEIKSKNDDSGAKARQYLEGLLKIPFGIYCEEPILKKVKTIQNGFSNTLFKLPNVLKDIDLPKKDRYTTVEMLQYVNGVQQYINETLPEVISQRLSALPIKCINSILSYIASVNKGAQRTPLSHLKSKNAKTDAIAAYLKEKCGPENIIYIYDIINNTGAEFSPINTLQRTITEFDKTRNSICEIKNDLETVTQILDDSIHGHTNAKNQILKIIGQWMSGEQSGYCFGFEGSPGIGKTSLAKKGLANCLKNGSKTRPFAFIALGGSCNGSTLEGHSYTYVNSTWGRITDILMETNCMNPIIYIDELDKVSKTEHGKEIIGILMHLIDTTQNSGFQDKYFSGIDLDLSKALFIFSYNDPAQIDKVLLDRIHRIRFDNLSLDEKKVIVKKYILPELNRKMGFSDSVILTDELIEYIIDTYTNESGVRKLKEVLFDLFGEINIELLKNTSDIANVPFVLTTELLNSRYLTKYHKVQHKLIHSTPEVGVINGLWASTNGKGGIIPIQTAWFPASSFLDLRLTGLQGDVMKESMNVAKSMAWKLLDPTAQREWLLDVAETKNQGLHIHCPEGAVSKDGPSAGTAITLAIYSLLTKRPIRNDVAITGEINLQGFITEIGGLEDKILGGVKVGIKTFLFPTSNMSDYEKFRKKYESKTELNDIRFIPVSEIHETFKWVFADETN
jgi:ATP-dependent Lon protease